MARLGAKGRAYMRQRVGDRDNWACRWCGKWLYPLTLTLDHIVTVEAGGSNCEHNFVACCDDCNKVRDNTPVEAGIARLIIEGR